MEETSTSERLSHASFSSQQPLLNEKPAGEPLPLSPCGSDTGTLVKQSQSDDEQNLCFMSLISMKVSTTPFSSTQSALSPTCRICQLPREENNILISPCKCDGTLKYIHGMCLRKWLETREKKCRSREFVARCELCKYTYRRHKFFKCSSWRCPRVALREKLLHTVFLVSLLLMIVSAVTTILCFVTVSRGDDGEGGGFRVQNRDGILTAEEKVTLACGIVFFVSFFVAMSVEIKAKKTIYQIICRFLRYNTVWVIENYQAETTREAP